MLHVLGGGICIVLCSTALIFCQHSWTSPTQKAEMLGDRIMLGYNLTGLSGGVDLPMGLCLHTHLEISSEDSHLFGRLVSSEVLFFTYINVNMTLNLCGKWWCEATFRCQSVL